MAKYKETIYLSGDYHIIAKDKYIIDKFGDDARFILEDTADVVLGKNWLGNYPKYWDFDKRPIVVQFLARLSAKGIDTINEPVLYGKVQMIKDIYRLSELFLLSEIEFDKSVREFNMLKKTNKIKIKKL